MSDSVDIPGSFTTWREHLLAGPLPRDLRHDIAEEMMNRCSGLRADPHIFLDTFFIMSSGRLPPDLEKILVDFSGTLTTKQFAAG